MDGTARQVWSSAQHRSGTRIFTEQQIQGNLFVVKCSLFSFACEFHGAYASAHRFCFWKISNQKQKIKTQKN